MTAPKMGFPEWGSSDPDIILSCDLTSLANVTAAGGAEIGAGTKTYSSGGVLLSATSGIKFTGLTAAQKALLARGGTLTCWIESSYIDHSRAVSSHEYALGYYGATNNQYYSVDRYSGDTTTDLFLKTTRASSRYKSYASTIGKDSYVRLDFTSRGPTGKPTLFIDYYPHTIHDTIPWSTDSTDFDNIILGGKVSAPTGPTVSRIKNLMVSTKPICVPASYKLGSIVIGGHSYMAQGDYMVDYGLFVAGTISGGRDDNYEAAVTATIHRELFKRGIGIGNDRVWNHSYGGTIITTATGGMAWQIAAYQAHTTRFQKVILMWGANEVVSTANTWISDYGPSGSAFDWQTTFNGQLDAYIAAGADTFFIMNQPYLSSQHATASGQAYRDRVDGLNLMIQAGVDHVNAGTAKAYLVDVWTAMGGVNSSNPSNWGGMPGTDQSHPNLTTSNLLGRLVANKIISTL